VSVRLEWEGKPTHVERLSLPFQTVETINESRATRERETGSLLGQGLPTGSPRNLLIWGDNKLVMSSLIEEYAGQVKLVYIDPPFDTGTDFSFPVSVGDASFTKLPSILEEHAYRDTWGAGHHSYLSMMYERLVLIHELLADDGALYLHVGRNVSHLLKLVCDEIFGSENYVNELTWKRAHAHGDTGQGARHFGRVTESILLYRKSEALIWQPQYLPYSDEVLKRDYKYTEEDGRRYRLMPVDGPGGAAKGNPYYEFLGVVGYWRYSKARMQQLYEVGEIVLSSSGKSLSRKRYLEDAKGTPVTDLWDDVNRISPTSRERLSYATQTVIHE
jgi:adenine specific DNA methylase Mod